MVEAFSSSELLSFIMYEDCATPIIDIGDCSLMAPPPPPETVKTAAQGRKKRRRRAKVCKNKEEAESQRMTHIAVERNRRKQMNEHLAVLRSLMPQSYVQRGDQASIVGGAIEYVKELEHILQTLEAKKLGETTHGNINKDDHEKSTINTIIDDHDEKQEYGTPFAQFFAHPQFMASGDQGKQLANHKHTSQSKASVADIEVTLIETHANIRILSHRRVRQLSKIVTSFHSFFLTILHLNVTTSDALVLYSISAKIEEGCQLSSADDVAGAVHHMLRIIEEEAVLGGGGLI